MAEIRSVRAHCFLMSTQRVAIGTEEQSDGVARTARSMEEMAQTIEALAEGAQHQAAAVATSFALSER